MMTIMIMHGDDDDNHDHGDDDGGTNIIATRCTAWLWRMC